MEPPTNVKLRQIIPHDFAIAFAGAVVEHVAGLEAHFYGEAWESASPKLERTQIYRVVRALTAYARGEQLLDGPVADYLGALAPLYASLLGTVTSGEPEHEPPDTALGVVIHAALGREQLASGGALSSGRLAALAGVTQAAIEALIASGELKAQRDDADDDWSISAQEASRWLVARTKN